MLYMVALASAGAFWGQTPLRKNKLSKENIKGEQ